MDKIVECVPNFSEGRDQAVIKAITDVIAGVSGVRLLDVDPGADTNRTVVTFIGTPEAVLEAAFAGIAQAARLIDMRVQHGEHPRHGATDVCPFVPVSGISMAECVQLARTLGERVGQELGIPVYLYENAARKEEWRSLANVRRGEYEALPDKLGTEEWRPDFGPNAWTEQVARTGVVTIGAREFLIAYNVNLNTRDKKLAHDIALSVREAGRKKRGPDGRFVRDAQGAPVIQPGPLKGVRAIGWYIDDYQVAQISINLLDYKQTPLWQVFETCQQEAAQRGLRVTGSELVGLVPKQALLDCGRHALIKQGRSPAVPEVELIHMAVKFLGLDDLAPFQASNKIVEYQIPQDDQLVRMSLGAFVDEVAMPSQAPGGGSVAAVAGALGAALGTMVNNLTKPKRYRDTRSAEDYQQMWQAAEELIALQADLLKAVDADTKAFNSVVQALRLPKNTAEEQAAREAAIQAGYREAAQVPYHTMQLCAQIFAPLKIIAQHGLAASASDVGVAALMAHAGLRAAALNVKINLRYITDQAVVEQFASSLIEYSNRAHEQTQEIMELVEQLIAAGKDA